MSAPPSITKRGGRGDARVTFEELAERRDADLDVPLGAALIARDVYPDLDVTSLLAELDALAAPLFSARLEQLPAEEQAALVSALVFRDLGFRGNEADYYDPRNSLLPDVLTRKVGIPLTLAIVYCNVARRVGVLARGVGFPGHFLVRIDRAGRTGTPLVLDPFYGGRILGDEELKTRLERAIGQTDFGTLESHLTAAGPRAILIRMLTNLKAIYVTRNERARAHLAVDRIASLLPDAAGPVVERGLLAVQLGARESARSDFTRALTLRPTDGEERLIRAELVKLGQARSSLN